MKAQMVGRLVAASSVVLALWSCSETPHADGEIQILIGESQLQDSMVVSTMAPKIINAAAQHESVSPKREIVAVFLHSDDCFTCEGLGRQVRELVRAAESQQFTMLLVQVGGREEVVRGWARAERIGRIGTLVDTTNFKSLDGKALHTPSAAIINVADATVRSFVQHWGSPGAEARSFAVDLALVDGFRSSHGVTNIIETP